MLSGNFSSSKNKGRENSLVILSSLSPTHSLNLFRLLSELGYRLVPETQSRAVSVICFEDPPQEEQQEDPPVPEEKISQEELAAMTLQHAEEIKNLQKEFA